VWKQFSKVAEKMAKKAFDEGKKERAKRYPRRKKQAAAALCLAAIEVLHNEDLVELILNAGGLALLRLPRTKAPTNKMEELWWPRYEVSFALVCKAWASRARIVTPHWRVLGWSQRQGEGVLLKQATGGAFWLTGVRGFNTPRSLLLRDETLYVADFDGIHHLKFKVSLGPAAYHLAGHRICNVSGGPSGPGRGVTTLQPKIGTGSGVGMLIVNDALFITDHKGHRVLQAPMPAGSPLVAFGKKGTGDGQFQNPSSLAFSAAQQLLFVSDTLNHRIAVLRVEAGQPLEWVAASSGPDRRGEPRVHEPKALGVHGNELFVACCKPGRIEVLSLAAGLHGGPPPLKYVRSIGGEGSALGPKGQGAWNDQWTDLTFTIHGAKLFVVAASFETIRTHAQEVSVLSLQGVMLQSIVLNLPLPTAPDGRYGYVQPFAICVGAENAFICSSNGEVNVLEMRAKPKVPKAMVNLPKGKAKKGKR